MHSGLTARALSCDIGAVSAGGRGAHCSEPGLLCGLCQASDAACTQGAAQEGRYLGEATTVQKCFLLRLPSLSHEQPLLLPMHVCPSAAMPVPLCALQQAKGAALHANAHHQDSTFDLAGVRAWRTWLLHAWHCIPSALHDSQPAVCNPCTSACRLSCRSPSGWRLGPGRRCAQCCPHWTQQSATCRSCGGFWDACSAACKPAQACQVRCSDRTGPRQWAPCWWVGASFVCKSCLGVLQHPVHDAGSAKQLCRAQACLGICLVHRQTD